jgi:hypothetical protein
MSWLERLRRLIWRAEEGSNELEYSMLDEVHRVEDALDSATGGRFYDAVEGIDERSGQLLEDLHLDHEPGSPAANGDVEGRREAGG